MKPILRSALTIALLVTGRFAHAANFPSNLSTIEVERIVEVIGLGGATKFLRSAEPYDLFPGIKFGMEISLVPSRGINTLGDASGTLPTINLMPRLYFTKGLFLDLELMFSFLPANILNTISTYGIGIKWTFSHEQDKWASSAVYFNYSNVTGFNNTYNGDDFEVGVLVGKDYTRLKPYLGFGLLFAQGSLDRSLVQAAANYNSWQSTIHVFLGSEIELPINVTFQFDFMNLAPMGSIFFGKKF